MRISKSLLVMKWRPIDDHASRAAYTRVVDSNTSRKVLVRVVGFSDEERHALNTLLRLSEERPTSYALWSPNGPPAGLALVDGESFEASGELASPRPSSDEKLFWVGPDAPERTAFTFQRPIQWPLVVDAMDSIFATPPVVDIDFDLDLDIDAPVIEQPPVKRVLVIDTDMERRFYWRSKLVLADWFFMDEAASGEAAKTMLGENAYAMVVVDFQLPDADPWQLVRLAHSGKARTIITVRDRSFAIRMRARSHGCIDCLKVPLIPSQVYYAIRKV